MVIFPMRVTVVCGDQVNWSSLLNSSILCLVVVMVMVEVEVVVMIDRCVVIVVTTCVLAVANTPR